MKTPTRGAQSAPRAGSPACVFAFVFVLIYVIELRSNLGRRDVAEKVEYDYSDTPLLCSLEIQHFSMSFKRPPKNGYRHGSVFAARTRLIIHLIMDKHSSTEKVIST